MDPITRTFEQVAKKVNLVMDRYLALKQDHSKLQEEHNRLKQKIKEKEALLDQLKQEMNLLKIAKGSSKSDEDTRKLKLTINEYVREIDRCLALLND